MYPGIIVTYVTPPLDSSMRKCTTSVGKVTLPI